MNQPALDDARSASAVERLLEESWTMRSNRAAPRELMVEALAAALFLGCAVPLALAADEAHSLNLALAGVLVVLYALASRIIKFPIGAGYVVPSYLVLVPMLLLLPPGVVPLLTAAGLILGTLGEGAVGGGPVRMRPERVLSAIPDAWHSLGPALVLLSAGTLHGGASKALVYIGALVAGGLFDLASSLARESAIRGVASRVQLSVIARVWLIDACVAPVGLFVTYAAREHAARALLILPLGGALLLLSKDRTARIAQAQHRLELIAHERERLQVAVRRLGEALAAKLDLEMLTDIVLRGSIEALDADAGRLVLSGPIEPLALDIGRSPQVAPSLLAAIETTTASVQPCQLQCGGVWALALPFGFSSEGQLAHGALAVARRGREFREDEQRVMEGLIASARQGASDIVAHQLLREQAITDPLTGLGNRRKLTTDLELELAAATPSKPLVLILFDLDGFKSYNDTFGHPAGDALLARLAGKLADEVAGRGTAYRLGGDEFCVLAGASPSEVPALVAVVAGALEERGDDFALRASYGSVLLPQEASNPGHALQLADERMYTVKRGRHRARANRDASP
ncbi:MAG: GGDEF domain-containing protein [Actinobacteria bacterium]|nr:MAG: GGDEF domain-containing protein [Actinomycetota bacterium]